MKRSGSLILGLLTMWPVVYIFFFIATMALAPLGAMPFGMLFAVHGVTMAITFGLLMYYVVHVLRSPRQSNERLLWAILLVVGSTITMPIYWYMCIWKPRGDQLP